MQKDTKLKICLVGDTLSDGGAEKSHAALSRYLAGRGIDVHNVIMKDKVTYNYTGELLNLGKAKKIPLRLIYKLKKLYLARNYIKKQQFDYVIDFRIRKKAMLEWLTAKFVFTTPTVYTVHNSHIDWYMPKQSWLTRAMYGKSYGVAALNQKMKESIEQRHGLKNVTVIYNIIDIAYINTRLLESKPAAGYDYILAAGRMEDNVKQFDKLITAYANSVLPSQNVKLVIMGKGKRQEQLQRSAASIGLSEKVIFTGFQENPYIYMRDALFYVMSSKFEGMPMVLIESLACGTPIISFDCPTGPAETIDDGVNGLLIEDQNVEKLTEGINRMYNDKVLYQKCKANAAKSAEKFSMENVGREWLEYLKIDERN